MTDTKTPQRIQRKRTKGWRMPEGAVYVGRGSRWGNPYVMRDESDRSAAVAWFEAHVAPTLDVTELRGKDLACWCGLDHECHGDILLEMAND
jgi:hypothetical protein